MGLSRADVNLSPTLGSHLSLWGGRLILGCGGKLLETLAAYVIRDRWEGRRSVGEREREDLGDLILRVAGLEWTKTELLSD